MPSTHSFENMPAAETSPKQDTIPIKKPEHQPKTHDHKIHTFDVGIPGQEKMVANTASNDQVAVQPYNPHDITKWKKDVVSKKEAAALENINNQPLEAKGALAHEAIESSRQETQDLEKLKLALDKERDSLFTIERASIDLPVPEAELYLLITRASAERVKQTFTELNYSVNKINNGLEVIKGTAKIVLLFSEDQVNPLTNNQPENTNHTERLKNLEKTIMEKSLAQSSDKPQAQQAWEFAHHDNFTEFINANPKLLENTGIENIESEFNKYKANPNRSIN